MTVDSDITLIGSANMDRRSFDLNYENNLLLCDEDTTARVRDRQMVCPAPSNTVTQADIEQWPLGRQLWSTTLAMLGPVL